MTTRQQNTDAKAWQTQDINNTNDPQKKYRLRTFSKNILLKGNSGEVLDKLRAGDFNASGLSTHDFSTLYTTLPHNLIQYELIDLIEGASQREGSLCLACGDGDAFFLLQKNLKNIMHGRVKMYVMRWPFCCAEFLFDLEPSWLDK